MVHHIIQLEARFYRLTPLSLRKISFKIVKVNGLVTRFSKEKETARKKWLSGYLKCHPEILFHSPEATSLARASGFNLTPIETFSNLLTDIIDENHISSQNIYNVDETGLTDVQKLSKV